MSESPIVFFSNRIEILLGQLKSKLFKGSTPFTKRRIIVSSPAMKSWVLKKLAEDSYCGIAAGIQIGSMEEVLEQIAQDLQQKDTHFVPLTSTDLALILEVEIKEMVQSDPIASSLRDFCHSPRKILLLAHELSKIFIDYGRYGQKMLQQWTKSPNNCTHWQQSLWLRIERRISNWGYPSRILANNDWNTDLLLDSQLHVFAQSYISHLSHIFLSQLLGHCPVHFYFLSPCQKFWGDLLTHKESQKLKKYWRLNKASQSQQMALEEYLRDSNSLLANFGKLGREMALQIEKTSWPIEEQYSVAKSAASHEPFEELMTEEIGLEERSGELTLLDAVQADLTLLRTPENHPKINFDRYDYSIQIHKAPKKYREIQILYDSLIRIIQRHLSDPNRIHPGDILVMAPNMGEYVPFIQAIFGSKESQLPFYISDQPVTSSSSTAQAFLELLQLPSTRWSAEDVIRILNLPSFQRKHKLSLEDVQTFKRWIKESGIHWGRDRRHRRALVPEGSDTIEEIGSWEYGFERLLKSLVEGNKDDLDFSLISVQLSDGELLGKFIELIRSFFQDLLPLAEDSFTLSLQEWSMYLHCLYEAYFEIPPNDENEENDQKRLWFHLNRLETLSSYLHDEQFSFSSIRKNIEASIAEESTRYKEQHLDTVRFCSTMSLRTVPAEVIVILGANDGVFPRQDRGSHLNLMLGNPGVDYFPSRSEYDRFLFLETILSARRYLILSYVSLSASGTEELAPSPLVSELLTYLDQSYSIAKQAVSQFCRITHPFHAFHKSYFCKSSLFPSYSQKSFKSALAYYSPHKENMGCFISEFPLFQRSAKKAQDKFIIDIRDLASFAKNPLKVFCNKTHGIYLFSKESETVKTEEDFEILPLDHAKLLKHILRYPPETVLEEAQKEGLLPQGPFKAISTKIFTEKVHKIQKYLSSLEITPNDLFEIEFELHTSSPQWENNTWKVPAISIDDGEIKIIGKISDVSFKGLVANIKKDPVDFAKYWPIVLCFSYCASHHHMPLADQLICLKSEKAAPIAIKNIESILHQYVHFYLTGLASPSPIIPEWLPALLKTDRFQELAGKSMSDPYRPIYNEYLKKTSLPFQTSVYSSIHETWKQVVSNIFAEQYHVWFPSGSAHEII